jgi:uncharacterized repeat protein (TIGR03803 family)
MSKLNGWKTSCAVLLLCAATAIASAAQTFTVLGSFPEKSDALPVAGFVQATDGDLYGTTFFAHGGGYGTVFKITTQGMLTTLSAFDGTDGQQPYPVIQAADGNFYGTRQGGGANESGACEIGCGTVFKMSAQGAVTVLSPLVQATNRIFYGTAATGGAYGYGSIFSLSVGLGPFVETEPSDGKVGAAIKILGTNLTGATSLTFNGTLAVFTVQASSVIKATVPAGATTGTVQVVTPSGTLSSNVPLRVAP